MSNKKQTSLKSYSEQVIQLFWKLENKEINIGEFAELHHNLYEQAKAMHKEEIKDAVDSCGYQDEAEYYYNETFGEDNR
jgi:hypothetical protein